MPDASAGVYTFTVMASLADEVLAYILMACIDMVYTRTSCIFTGDTCAVRTYFGYGLCSHGLYSYGSFRPKACEAERSAFDLGASVMAAVENKGSPMRACAFARSVHMPGVLRLPCRGSPSSQGEAATSAPSRTIPDGGVRSRRRSAPSCSLRRVHRFLID